MRRRLFSGCLVVPGAGLHPVMEPRDILVEGNFVVAVAAPGIIEGADEVVDARGLLAAPGLINGHLHSWDHYLKGRFENLQMQVMMAHIRPAKPVRLTDRQVYRGTMIGAIESLRTGATTIVDDMSVGQTLERSHVEAALQAYEDSGIRAYLGFSMIDKPLIDSWPFVDECFTRPLLVEMRALPRPDGASLVELVRQLAITHHPRRVGPIVAPSAPQRCTDDFLRTCRRLADELDLPTIIHLLETRLQVVTSQVLYGRSMVEHLSAIGFLKPATALIHAVWTTPSDRVLIAEAGASVQYNPWSNVVIGSRIADFRAAKDAGINVSMGSDGCGATFTCSMLNALKVGIALPRVRTPQYDRWASAEELFAVRRRRCRGPWGGRASSAGSHQAIAPIPCFIAATASVCRHSTTWWQLVHSESGAGIDTVVVDGEIAMRGSTLVRVDEVRLVREFQSAYKELVPAIVESERASRALLEGIERVYRKALTIPVAPETMRALVDSNAGEGCA
jgi:5-methylthioadenosine/S-adenosylhomocysteine deaminase